MRYNKPVLTRKEFADELQICVDWLTKAILRKGKCRYRRNGPRGHYLIDREWADEYLKANTFGGTAYKH